MSMEPIDIGTRVMFLAATWDDARHIVTRKEVGATVEDMEAGLLFIVFNRGERMWIKQSEVTRVLPF